MICDLRKLSGYFLICFAFLALITVGAGFGVERYERVGSELLGEDWQVAASDSGRAREQDGIWRLASDDAGKSVRIRQAIDSWDGRKQVCLNADLRCSNLAAGEKSWHKARLVLGQYDADGKRLDLPHVAAAISGSRKWRNYSEVFAVSPKTREMKVSVELNRSTGEVWIRDAGLHGVRQTEVYTWTSYLIFGAWGVFFLALAGRCAAGAKGRRFFLKAALVLAFLAVIAGTTMPGETKNRIRHGVEDRIESAGKSAGAADLLDKVSIDITKAAHFGLFAAVGMLLFFLMPGARIYEIVTILLMLAGGTELVQLFIDGRSPLATDFLIDAAGGACGVVGSWFTVHGS